MPQIRVMTFNLRGDRFADGANVWPARAELCVRTIRRQSPDLIGFQELLDGNLAVLRAALPGHEFYLGPGYNDDEPFAYPAICWRRDRFALAASGGFWLSETPDRHSRSWETACIRSAAWVRLRCAESGREVALLNTHLDHVSEPARVGGARLIAGRLAEIAADAPLLVTGDFNCNPGSEAYRILAAAGLADTFAVADERETFTFHGFHGAGFPAHRRDDTDRIDWVLTRDMRPLSCAIVRDAEPPIYPSDHYPVVAELAY